MTNPEPSRKSRLHPVYTVPAEEPHRTQQVIFQLEDMGHPVLRLRPSVRLLADDGETRFLYRVTAFSRMTGRLLGDADRVAPLGSQEAFAAAARQFQSAPFRMVIDDLSSELVGQFAESEANTPAPG